jgi:hypothetical protein
MRLAARIVQLSFVGNTGERVRIPEEILKSVVFVGVANADGSYDYRGTAFLVSVPSVSRDPGWIFLVTAKQ